MPKISALPNTTVPAATDIVPFVDNSGTPATRKATVANLAASAAFGDEYAPLDIDATGVTVDDVFNSTFEAANVSGALVGLDDKIEAQSERVGAQTGADDLLAWDTFDRTLIGDADSGQTWTGTGTPAITDGRFVQGTAWIDVGESDVAVETTLRVGATAGGARFGQLLRATDHANCIRVGYSGSGGLAIEKRVAGTVSVLASTAFTRAVGRPYRLRSFSHGAVIGVSVVDPLGVVVTVSHTLTGGDETTFAAQTSVGVQRIGGGVDTSQDDLIVRAI